MEKRIPFVVAILACLPVLVSLGAKADETGDT